VLLLLLEVLQVVVLLGLEAWLDCIPRRAIHVPAACAARNSEAAQSMAQNGGSEGGGRGQRGWVGAIVVVYREM
jgi:hypothetical protein